MSKILLFIFDGMTDCEITFVAHLLKTNGKKQIISIAYEDKLVIGASGLVYKPDQTVADALSDEAVDGLIIPGGWYGDTRFELLELIRQLHAKGKLISGICGAGTVFLAKAGVLDQARYTTPIVDWTQKHKQVFADTDPFPRENFIWKRVVRDRNIITAQGSAFVDFAIEIYDLLGLFQSEEEKEDYIKSFKGSDD